MLSDGEDKLKVQSTLLQQQCHPEQLDLLHDHSRMKSSLYSLCDKTLASDTSIWIINQCSLLGEKDSRATKWRKDFFFQRFKTDCLVQNKKSDQLI